MMQYKTVWFKVAGYENESACDHLALSSSDSAHSSSSNIMLTELKWQVCVMAYLTPHGYVRVIERTWTTIIIFKLGWYGRALHAATHILP